MSEHQQYYDHFCTGYWASKDPEACRCRGNGWALSELDTWHICPIHFHGQPHPEEDHDAPTKWTIRCITVYAANAEEAEEYAQSIEDEDKRVAALPREFAEYEDEECPF